MKGTAYVKIRSGPTGQSAAWARYITEKESVRSGLDGVRLLQMPERVTDAAATGSHRAFQRAFVAHARARQQLEIAGHGNRAGSPRTHYRQEFSFPTRQVDEQAALDEVEAWKNEHFPKMCAALAAHRDTDQFHVHLWGDARQTDGSKVHISKADFRRARADWGRRHARLMAETEKRTRGLSDEEAAEREEQLKNADMGKLEETSAWRREVAQHYDRIENGSIAQKMYAKAHGPPEKPKRIGDRPRGAAVYRRRDRRNARQEQERAFSPDVPDEERQQLRNRRMQQATDHRQHEREKTARTGRERWFSEWAKTHVRPQLDRARGRIELEKRLRRANVRLQLDETAPGGAIITPRTTTHPGDRQMSVALAELDTSVEALISRFGTDLKPPAASPPKPPPQSARQALAESRFSLEKAQTSHARLGKLDREQQRQKHGREGRSL